MNTTHVSPLVTILVSVAPVVLILMLLFYMLRKAQKNTDLSKVNPGREQLLTGVLWIIVGIGNFMVEANRHAHFQAGTFQQVYGVLAVALGSFFLGLGASTLGKHTRLPRKRAQK